MGIEPTSLQSQYNILPLNYYHPYISGGRDLNSQPFTPKINVLPIKLPPYRKKGLNLHFQCQKLTSFHLDDSCMASEGLEPSKVKF
jgi:hypothetical protein